MEKEKLLQPRECEECNTIIYYTRGKTRSYILWQKDAGYQTGISKKYSNEIAGYCKKH